MSRHLDEHEVSSAVAGLELEEEVRQHLASCLDCHRTVAGLRRLIERRRELLAGEAPDWEVQREAVLSRLDGSLASRRRRWLRPAVAAAGLLAAAAIGALWPWRQDVGGRELPVEEILAESEALLANESIPGFELIDPGLDLGEGRLEGGRS